MISLVYPVIIYRFCYLIVGVKIYTVITIKNKYINFKNDKKKNFITNIKIMVKIFLICS